MNDYSLYGPEPDDFIRQEFFFAKSILASGGNGYSVPSVTFDSEEELLWAGSNLGLISSFYGLNFEPYSSFQGHDHSEVHHIQVWDQHVLSLTSDTLNLSSKHGQPVYQYRSSSMSELRSALLSPPNRLYLGGFRSDLIEFDIETRQELRKVEIESTGNVILRFSNSFLCSGSTGGVVSLLDPKSLNPIHTLTAHTSTLSDFDVCGNQLVTCGFSLRNGQVVVDRYLMIFDLRNFKAMTPMQMVIDPMFLRFVQTYSSRICVVSQTGQFQILEQGCSAYHSPIYEVPVLGNELTSCAVSLSNQVLAFGDSNGFLHTFVGNHENPVFNHFAADTEFDLINQPLSKTNFSSQLPEESLYYCASSQPHPSEWSDLLNLPSYSNLDAGSILYDMTLDQGHGNTFYPPQTSCELFSQSHVQHKIKSNGLCSSGSQPKQQGDDQKFLVPKCYRKVEIKYSKYGVDGFDFRSYNTTEFAGLETHIPNAYCNAMIQVLYFTKPLRNSLINHLCSREFCLSCELGFLFHMLQQESVRTCQATNFLRAFRTIPQATALGLLLSDSDEALGKVNLVCLIQSWNRFILQQIESELTSEVVNKLHQDGVEKELHRLKDLSFTFNALDLCPAVDNSSSIRLCDTLDEKLDCNVPESDSAVICHSDTKDELPPTVNLTIVKQLFAHDMSIVLSCKVCGELLKRKTSSLVVDMIYPVISEVVKVPFYKIVERSLNDEHMTRSWCSSCNKYQMHYQRKALDSLPDVLSLNCCLESPSAFAFWKAQEENGSKARNDITVQCTTATKFCRYGSSCARADCKFRHDKPRNSSSTSENSRFGLQNWVPFEFKLSLTPDGKVRATETDDQKTSEPNMICYELFASVVCIREKSDSGSHLVSHIKVEEQSAVGKDKLSLSEEQWYLFNDFAITAIDKNLAVSFDMDWKLPCLLFFAKANINKKYNIPFANPITSDVLFGDESLVTPRITNMKFVPLDETELPQEGDIVGLDAEFVILNPEKAELHSDGTKSTIKPSQMSVARVTCIRQKGPLHGIPFIDNYISTQEQVADYLTEYSGIEPGDLDPMLSCKYLTTLKSTYLKLRYLINAKVIFVGHGLKKDFRVLNLIVPPDQVVDTVELFHLPKRRMISLKFLVWYFLGLKIQSRNHDSIEDSSAAVRLYNKYLELCTFGLESVHQELEGVYEIGQLLNWKIPDDEDCSSFLKLDDSIVIRQDLGST